MWRYSADTEVSDFGSLENPRRLEESHQRCRAAGINPDLSRLDRQLDTPERNEFFSRQATLGAYSTLLFSDIYRDLADRNYLFVLTDNTARLITFHSCPEILVDATEEIGMSAGTLLSEESCGTNAVALALRYREPAVTHGMQHYCRLFHRWCVVAVPVMRANRQPIACVAISNCNGAALTEKLALARFIAKDIEVFRRTTPTYPGTDGIGACQHDERRVVDLTPRQRQVLTLFAKGFSYKQIARKLGIGSARTVEEHLDAVRGKLHVSHRRECIQKAIALGVILRD